MPLCIRENLRDGVKRGCRSLNPSYLARGGRTVGRVLHQKEGGLLGAIKRQCSGPEA